MQRTQHKRDSRTSTDTMSNNSTYLHLFLCIGVLFIGVRRGTVGPTVRTVTKTAMRALELVTAFNTRHNVATATAITNVVLKAILGAVRAFLSLLFVENLDTIKRCERRFIIEDNQYRTCENA